jgi:hypothetical protein
VTEFNIDAFRLTAERLHLIESAQRDKPTVRPRRERVRGPYLRGPVPMAWLLRACRSQRGNSEIYIGLLLWHRYGMQRSRRNFRGDREAIRINLSKLAIDNRIPRRFLQRGLTGLERRGLVTVERRPGQVLMVRIVHDMSASNCQELWIE